MGKRNSFWKQVMKVNDKLLLKMHSSELCEGENGTVIPERRISENQSMDVRYIPVHWKVEGSVCPLLEYKVVGR